MIKVVESIYLSIQYSKMLQVACDIDGITMKLLIMLLNIYNYRCMWHDVRFCQQQLFIVYCAVVHCIFSIAEKSMGCPAGDTYAYSRIGLTKVLDWQ